MSKEIIQYQNITLDFFTMAPTLLTMTQYIPCSANALFNIFKDAQSWPIWASSIHKIIWTSDKPYGIGSTRTAYLKGDFYADEVFIDWQEDSCIAFKFTQGTVPVNAFGERYIIKILDHSSCELTWNLAISPRGLSKILMPVTKPLLRYYLQSLLKNLSQYAQQQTLKQN